MNRLERATPREVYLRDDIAALWSREDALARAFGLRGEVFRDVAGRRTLRVEIQRRYFFVKLHYGVGWAEIFKNWLLFKRPILGASNEFEACRGLAEAGIAAPVVAAYALSRGNLASRQSFVLCDELAGYTSLEDCTDLWHTQAPDLRLKQRVLYAVADFARRFHAQGFIHRDFYICHLLAEDAHYATGQVSLAVLDLHRARRFDKIPQRWLKRDLAALLFSTMDLGYSRRDWLRFIRIYTGQPLSSVMAERGAFWQSVLERAEKLYDEGLRKGVVKGLYRS
jgi:heptose I phosphotransferase